MVPNHTRAAGTRGGHTHTTPSRTANAKRLAGMPAHLYRFCLDGATARGLQVLQRLPNALRCAPFSLPPFARTTYSYSATMPTVTAMVA